MKNKIIILLLILACRGFLSVYAQEMVMKLEAEEAELASPVKVKYANGYSGNAYVGDNDPGSVIVFRYVNIENEGTYEFQTYYTSMHIRSLSVKSGNYPGVIVTTPKTTADWNTPPVGVMTTYIYLNQGMNSIAITPYNGGGPNIDKFEIRTTSVQMPRPEPAKNTFAYDLTDDAVVTSNRTTDNLSCITDNDEYTIYTYSGSSAEIKIECNMPYLLTGYFLSPGANGTQNPKSWKLEYSTDGKIYSVIAPSKTEDLENGTLSHITRQPHQETNKAAQYYRLTAYGSTIGDVQLFGIPFLANTDKKNFPVDMTQELDIRSKALGEPLGVYQYGSFDERYYNLFDRDMSRKYYFGDIPNFTVEVELDNPAILGYYTLTSCQDYPERDPKSWLVEGFDRDWETISEVHDFQFPTRYATMKFHCKSNKKYRGYRLKTLGNNGADGFQLLKWQLFEGATGSSTHDIHLKQATIFSSARELVIRSENSGLYWVTNLSGQLITSGQFDSSGQKITLDNGIYIVKLAVDKEFIVQKVAIH